MEIVQDGLTYVIKALRWDEVTSTQDASMSINPEARGDTPKFRMNMGTYQVMLVAKSLKSWEFRGTDENMVPLTDGEVLPITEKNVGKLPPRHGQKLWAAASELNGLGDDEEKN